MEEEYFCPICNEKMFISQFEVSCVYCGIKAKEDYVCGKGHYICEKCRTANPKELILNTCKISKEKDALKLAILLMKHPGVPTHGPEHHYIVGCTFLTALKNLGIFNISSSDFDKIVSRSIKIPYGACGSWGACGAAISAGIAFSVASKANMLSKNERRNALTIVSKTLGEIAKLNGPRCCKASVFLTLIKALKIINELYGINYEVDENYICEFSERNEDCLKERCPFHGK
ncbi:hypothetical protein KEJ50_06535 [Candidatus Bathyarchaeota archaeon]|nr:hypothetical protein [Candidatus Bathyarchaeota archaeon]